MAGELDILEATLLPMTNAVDGITTLVAELTRLVRENAYNPARILAVAAEIDAKTKILVDATLAGTPADPNLPPV